ncbi:stage III sporulation protein AF [Metabacillus hrfriensis]|uniref:Stage III sporulation protein AF n=1 Tax=Metabacillus hrfriensis TaxID=3048891 RepID=A0ACD4R8J2_9BACI|nr:stage III sporulation protein AF [Metabacillus sp. CT-WN-B3]USK27261.1 stage III sporulation protein AF [Bacillus sp. CMF21]WHZ56485.1 stage III sporulation protein AF [Metabacillus sp. CT-WN-B3]
MSFLTEWIANIILFIMLAVILDLLLPNSAMQKYAKMVISLLLIVIILSPIFKLLSADINTLVADVQMESPAKEEEIKKMIDLQKKEIQASNDAYILENMAVQLKSQAKEELVQSYDVTIKQISLSVDEPFEEIQKSLQGIEVTLEAEEAGSEAVETIQPVDLGAAETAETQKENQIRRASEIKAYLASIWEVDPEKISLKMEGGEGSTDE